MTQKNAPSELYFSPEGKVQQLSRENLLILLGGQRALLMQVAHPLVGQGVLDHSSVRKDPLKRLKRTLQLTQTLIFGTKEEVLASAEKINRVHKAVKGNLNSPVGTYTAGEAYHAINNDLLIWVWATLIDTAVTVYETFISPLSNTEKEQYYQESKMLLPLLGADKQKAPKNFEELTQYINNMYKNGKIAVNNEVKQEITPYLLLKKPDHIKLPLLPVSYMIEKITTGLLPQELREQYGLSWTTRDQKLFNFLATGSRKVYRSRASKLIPNILRFSPYYRKVNKHIKKTN